MDNIVYYFPWVRKGLGSFINEQDTLGKDGSTLGRPGLTIKSNYTATHNQVADAEAEETSAILLEKTVSFTGPGDILQVNSSAVMKIHPEKDSEGFPVRYLPYVEFWEPDFLWRYTPASDNQGRLRPWLALVALPEKDVRLGTTADNVPYFTYVGDEETWNGTFLEVEELFRTAHAQGDTQDDPRFCRLLGMRNIETLQSDTEYVALLIPAYETGRLRGLGWDEEKIKEIPAQRPSWESGKDGQSAFKKQKARTQGLNFPVYFKWHFKTGDDDFDRIAARLEPACVQKSGLNLDVTDMGEGFSYNSVEHEGYRTSILMPAATKVVAPLKKGNETAFPDEKREGILYDNLQGLLSKSPVFTENKAESQGRGFMEDPGDEDPWVVPPVYGARHAMSFQLIDEAKPWLKELNMDIRNRAAAGLGRKVVQQNQEDLMDRAWRQVEAVQAMNQELYNRLMSIRANQSLRAKTVDNYQDSAKYIEYMMRNLSSMLGAGVGEEGKYSISSIIAKSGIPASFAAPSFQNNAEKLSHLVKGLDTKTLMESIVEKQLFRFTPQRPVGAMDMNSVIQWCQNAIEAMKFDAYSQSWKSLFTADDTKTDGAHRNYRVEYVQREITQYTLADYPSSSTFFVFFHPYQAFEAGISPLDPGMACSKIESCSPDSFAPYTQYRRVYVMEDDDYSGAWKDLNETKQGLSYVQNGKKKLLPVSGITLSNADYELMFGNDDVITQVAGSRYFYVKSKITDNDYKKTPSLYHLNYKDVWEDPSGYFYSKANNTAQWKIQDAGTKACYEWRQVMYAGSLSIDYPKFKDVFRHTFQTYYKKSRGEYGAWTKSGLESYIKAVYEDYAQLFDQLGFDKDQAIIEAYQKDLSLIDVFNTTDSAFPSGQYSVPHNRIGEYWNLSDSPLSSNCAKNHFFLVLGCLLFSERKEIKLMDIYGIYLQNIPYDVYRCFIAAILSNLRNHIAPFLEIWELVTLNKDKADDYTYVASLCYSKRVGPWFTSRLHCYMTGKRGYPFEDMNTFLKENPSFRVIKKSSLDEFMKVSDETIGDRLEHTLLKLSYDEKYQFVLMVRALAEQLKAKQQPKVKDKPVAVDNKAVNEHQQSVKNKEALERMQTVASDFYENYYSDSAEGNQLRADMLEKLLMSKYPILAYPFFPEPTYHYLNMLSDKFIIPGLSDLPMDSIAMFTTNPTFTEAFLAGMNTEMGAELQWREYPTDRRGSYFRKFWDSESSVEAIQDNRFFDIQPLHLWDGTHLGENHLKDKGNLLIFAIHSDLFKLYPNTRVYLNKAERGVASKVSFGLGKVDPVMESFIREDVLLVGFNMTLAEALGNPTNKDYGYMLTFEQHVDDLNFFQTTPLVAESDNSDVRAKNLIDDVTIYGKHISRFIDLTA